MASATPACSSWCRRVAAKRSIETMRSANVGSVKPGIRTGADAARGSSPWAQRPGPRDTAAPAIATADTKSAQLSIERGESPLDDP